MGTRATSKLSIVVLFLGLCSPAGASDRWAALSLIESGDNDKAIGPHGEISRYQMQPDLWKRYAPTNADWTKPEDSLGVAKAVMQQRCDAFERSMHRPPTDFEFYVLWNAPGQVKKPSKAVSRRAERFANVVEAQKTIPDNPPADSPPPTSTNTPPSGSVPGAIE
jgi:hypothetical protein